MQQPSSNLFEGYRSVGHVTGPHPFIVRHAKNPKDTRIITIVGKTFHTYSNNLNLIQVSIPHEIDIRMIIADTTNVYAASGRSVICWAGGSRKLTERFDNGHQADVRLMCKFEADKMVSIDEDNVLISWGIKNKEMLNIISFDDAKFKISTICHPYNYKNKILLGSEQGTLELWNVPNEQCIYKFHGWDSAITCLTQSPIEDVVGIGLADGHVYIHNIKYDEVVMKIYQEYGCVTSMSFRLDGQPYLVTASEIGHLMVWNLERKRLSSQIRNAHCERISKCQFIRNESLLVTSGSDNSLKIWTMDLSDGGGTLLCQREGHHKPPSFIRFYGPKEFNLLSAGHDSTLKMFHIYSERLNRNLGTARMNPKSKIKTNRDTINKLPPIVRFSAETAKEKQWDNIACCHQNSSLVTTWNYDKCRMGEHFIMQPSFDKNDVHASCVCVTSCGNFVVIGFTNGLIFKYNIQSGIFRQTYECSEVSEHRAHNGSITGLDVDSLGIILISGGTDSKLRLWNFKTGVLLITTDCFAKIQKIELHRENNMLAIALDNQDIEIMDLETRTLVRRFSTKSSVLDMTFSPDSRWLIVSYEDAAIRTWDLNLGKLIDAFRLSSPCTTLSISATGEFLATAHENSLGINIWCNYTVYCPTQLRAIDSDKTPPLLDMPFVRCDELSQNEDEENEDQTLPAEGDLLGVSYVSPEQLHHNLLTMSGLPASRWKNLLNIDEIRAQQLIEEEERRGPKPVKVPFFIPVKDGLKPKLDGDTVLELNQRNASANQESLLQSKIQELSLLSPLAQALLDCAATNDYSMFLNQLKELGPSKTDAEIRSLGKDTCGNNKPMLSFLSAIEQGLQNNTDYELISSWLALFLKAHSDLIQTDREINSRCLELLDPVRSRWHRLSEEFNQIFCVLNFIRSSIL